MAHFAELDTNNKVLRVVVISNEVLMENGKEVESKGIDFCKSLYGSETNWVQTSYNKNFRKNFAGIGNTYSIDLDAFIPDACHEEATFDTDLALWNCTNEEHIGGKNAQ